MNSKHTYFNVYDLFDEELIAEEITISEVCELIRASNASYIQTKVAKGDGEFIYKKQYKIVVAKTFEPEQVELTEADKDAIVGFYQRGAPLQVLAEGYHVGALKIKAILQERGIKLRDRVESHKLSIKNKHKEIQSVIDELNRKKNATHINDLGKVKALMEAGWSIEKIAGEFSTDSGEVRRCLEILKMN